MTTTMTTRKHSQRLLKLPQSRDLSHRAQWGADHGPLLNRSCRRASLQIQSVRPQSRAWRKKRRQEEVTVWPTQVDRPAGRDSLPSQQRGKTFSRQNSSQKRSWLVTQKIWRQCQRWQPCHQSTTLGLNSLHVLQSSPKRDSQQMMQTPSLAPFSLA